MYTYTHETVVESDIESTFEWFEHEGSFRRLMPPWEVAEEVRADDSLEVGSQRVFRFPAPGAPFLKMTWIAEHTAYDPPKHFSDTMVKGPFWSWNHDHDLSEVEGITTVKDEVSYQVPFGPLGNLADRLLGGSLVKGRISRMFKARELRLQRDLREHSKFSNLKRKRILVAGSSGLIGTQLVAFLDTGGHDVWRLVRRESKEGSKELSWYPDKGVLNPDDIEGFDVIIHLGGAGIGDKRWNKKRKKLIVQSRKDSTTLLSDTMSKLKKKPEAFIVASAIGYYGNRADEELTEDSSPGDGFLTETVIQWESYADSAREAGIRVVNTRNGIVLSAAGGALGRMLLPWKMGGGGPLAGGKQWMSWISLDDEIYAIHHLMMSPECEGAYNLTAPQPVRQKDFSKTLGKVLRRPAFAPIPGFSMKILFGELAGPLLIEGQRVLPKRIQDSGYEFLHKDLESALRDSLGIWR
ncbi:MAG: TIGR01777 family protein [Euryarchaeota archaeon]|nr:TIGR01777 family protein [Euryarchaeota archaeon]|tara:strand:+ start:9452 stop:10849 length:1398 start_codon:yes stop_codon:yes gene_type:complete